MLKFLFWSLLLANGALFVFHQGYLGDSSERETSRLSQQINTDKLKLTTASAVNATAAAAAATAASNAAAEKLLADKKLQMIACTEVGNFSMPDARRFEAQVAALALGDRQSRRNVQVPETSSFVVYIPAPATKEATDKKVAELRQLGITNYFVIQDNPSLRGAISLGVFKTEVAAQNHLANLNTRGVHSARIFARKIAVGKLMFQLRDINVEARDAVAKIMAEFPEQEIRSCK